MLKRAKGRSLKYWYALGVLILVALAVGLWSWGRRGADKPVPDPQNLSQQPADQQLTIASSAPNQTLESVDTITVAPVSSPSPAPQSAATTSNPLPAADTTAPVVSSSSAAGSQPAANEDLLAPATRSRPLQGTVSMLQKTLRPDHSAANKR